ncbi:AIPR family protein [Halarcobacter sp.]|uniref:AIPR family protein n=1 Tax=Halarcobacter sp. TaxID=2321133 RepID=UPI002AA70CCC|nr:AIPR family protein [Halarcobacter sp.]
MSSQIELFRENYLQDIFNSSEVNNDFYENVFTEKYAKELQEIGEIDEEIEISYWYETGIKVNGYSYDEDEQILNLFVTVFSQDISEKSLTKTEINQAFNRLEKFYKNSSDKSYYSKLEESTPVYDISYIIHKNKRNFSKIRFYLLSNKIISEKAETPPSVVLDEIEYSYRIWDISRLFRMNSSKQQREDILIDFDEISETPIYCLPAHLNTSNYESYLLVLPGTILSKLYADHGSKLLEQNVRTFLQAQGKVNKGIRNTILKKPDKFFAYNNGLTTIAEEIITEQTKGGLKIKKLKNLQIVNGGQTSASIYRALIKDKAKDQLSKLFVQVKLTIAPFDLVDDESEDTKFVQKISEYANTQNKVNAADFFSNHPFHVRMEEFSRRVYAKDATGGHRETKWFYERARGQYKDEQAFKTPAEVQKFLKEYPKKQLITKTDFSKYENVWEGIPDVVAKGAQYSFVEYAKEIGKKWEKGEAEYNEFYYKSAIAKAIIFKATEDIISNSPWYDGGFRAQTVAYSISYLDHIIKQKNKYFDFMNVWDKQKISFATQDLLKVITKTVYEDLTNPPTGVANVSQWAKKPGCWQSVQKIQIEIPSEFMNELLDKEEFSEDKKIAKKQQKQDNGIEAQKKVFDLIKNKKWQEIKSFAIDNNELTAYEIGLIDKAIIMHNDITNKEKVSIDLMNAVYRLEDIGLEI